MKKTYHAPKHKVLKVQGENILASSGNPGPDLMIRYGGTNIKAVESDVIPPLVAD